MVRPIKPDLISPKQGEEGMAQADVGIVTWERVHSSLRMHWLHDSCFN